MPELRLGPEYVRRQSIGGSDVGPILGLGRFTTPAQIWDRIKGLEGPRGFSQWQIRGQLMEPHIRELFNFVSEGNFALVPFEPFIHGAYPFHYSPDSVLQSFISRLRGQHGLLECKALNTWVFKDVRDNGIQAEYYAQMQHGFYVSGYTWGRFAVFNSDMAWLLMLPREHWAVPEIREMIDQSFLVIEAERDDEWLSHAVPSLLDWWEKYIVGNVRPPMTDEDYEGIITWPESRAGSQVNWIDNDEFNEALLHLKEAREHFDLAEHAKKLAEARVKEMMGDVEVAIGATGRVSWKSGTRKTLDTDRVKREHPEINWNDYYTQSSTRTFRPTF